MVQSVIGDKIEIVPFRDEFARAFAKLNYEWIEKYFRVEAHDRELLDSPVEQIIRKGGEIFFAVSGNKQIGTVALVVHTPSDFELTKMAVASEFQGRGIGKLLMMACVEHARSAGKTHIFLESNTGLEPAIALYRSCGFEEVPLDPNSNYSRVNIRMRLALSDLKR